MTSDALSSSSAFKHAYCIMLIMPINLSESQFLHMDE